MNDRGESVSLPQKTADAMLDTLIASGRYTTGDRLPSENELSQKYGVSRSTLREAIKILAAKGVVEIHRGTGTFISGIPEGKTVALPDKRKTRMELRDLYEIRFMLEPRAAAAACLRASDAELEEIVELTKNVQRLIDIGRDPTEADIAFHSAIIRASHNEFIQVMIPLVAQAMRDRHFIMGDDAGVASYTPDHSTITEFLTKRDPIGIQAAITIHLRRMASALGVNADITI